MAKLTWDALSQIGGLFLWPNDNAQLAVGHIGDLIGDRYRHAGAGHGGRGVGA